MPSKVASFTKVYFKSSAFKNISRLAASNLFTSIVGIVGTFIQARFVSPEDLGYFRSFEIATGYAFFLHLGILGAFQRFYPYYMGQNRKELADEVVSVSFAWNFLISVIVGGSFLTFSLVNLLKGNWPAFLGWLVQFIIIVNYFYGGHLSILFSSSHNFTAISRGSFLSSLITLLTLPFFLFSTYLALALRTGLGTIGNLLFLHFKRPIAQKLVFNWQKWFNLIKLGFPMFVASYAAGIGWDTIERTIILFNVGNHDLGLWVTSFTLLTILRLIPQAMTSVYIPRVMETFGKSGNIHECMDICIKPIKYALPLMIFIVILSFFLLPPIISFLIPKYREAVPIMSIMIMILPLDVLALPYAIIIAEGKIGQQNLLAFSSLGLFLVLSMISLKMGLGLIGVVTSSVVSKAIRVVLIYYLIKISPLRRK